MTNWNKVTDNMQVCKVQKNNNVYTFTLKLQKIGCYSAGRSLVLWGKVLKSEPEVLASFWIKDDGYNTYNKDSYKNCLWSIQQAEDEALQIVNKVVENVY